MIYLLTFIWNNKLQIKMKKKIFLFIHRLFHNF